MVVASSTVDAAQRGGERARSGPGKVGAVRSAPARHESEPEHLFHYSEDPAIDRFVPHVPATNPGQAPMVWTIDDEHAPLFWFPRDCPRITYWSEGGPRVHVMEEAWVARLRACRLYAYRFALAPFRPWSEADGYWVSEAEVVALDVEPVGDLFERHHQRGIELRVVPDLRPVRKAVLRSDARFSMCRMANMGPGADRPS